MDNVMEFSGITNEEISAARHCLEYALSSGASKARVSVSKNVQDSIQLLNGEVDKVSRNADRVLKEAEVFISKAIERTKMLTPDKFRDLPSPDRYALGAVTGMELGLYDRTYEGISAEDRIAAALSGSIYGNAGPQAGYGIISEECEYSDSVDDCYMADSQGFEGRHTETSFSFWSEPNTNI